MFRSPREAIEKGWIRARQPFEETQIQQVGIDCRLLKLFTVVPGTAFYLGSHSRIYPKNKEVAPLSLEEFGFSLAQNENLRKEFYRPQKQASSQIELYADIQAQITPFFQDKVLYPLYAGQFYIFDSMELVSIPDKIVAWGKVRSGLNRGGLLVTTGLYDPGYSGVFGGALRPRVDCILEEGARLCQIIFADADNDSLYNGHNQGQNSFARMG